jgi:hypothetical protein
MLGCAMDARYLISALIGAFCLFAIFVAITTARYLSQREGGGGRSNDEAESPNRICSADGFAGRIRSRGIVRWHERVMKQESLSVKLDVGATG